MDHQQFIVYYGEVVAKNWSSLLIEVTISRRLFVVMPENGIFCEFNFSNGILWEFSHIYFFQIFCVLDRTKSMPALLFTYISKQIYILPRKTFYTIPYFQ